MPSEASKSPFSFIDNLHTHTCCRQAPFVNNPLLQRYLALHIRQQINHQLVHSRIEPSHVQVN